MNQRITLDESSNDKYSSRFTIAITDPEGHVFTLAPGTEEGARIKVEPFHQ